MQLYGCKYTHNNLLCNFLVAYFIFLCILKLLDLCISLLEFICHRRYFVKNTNWNFTTEQSYFSFNRIRVSNL